MAVPPPGCCGPRKHAPTLYTCALVFLLHFGPWLRQADQGHPCSNQPPVTKRLETNQNTNQPTHPQQRTGQSRCCLYTGGQGKSWRKTQRPLKLEPEAAGVACSCSPHRKETNPVKTGETPDPKDRVGFAPVIHKGSNLQPRLQTRLPRQRPRGGLRAFATLPPKVCHENQQSS